MASSRKLRVVIVVGEASGDTLGAAVLQELGHRYSQIEAVGIGGPLMLSSGVRFLVRNERAFRYGIR